MTPRRLNLAEANAAVRLQQNLNAENAGFIAQLLNGEQTLDGLLDRALNTVGDQAEPLMTAYLAFCPIGGADA